MGVGGWGEYLSLFVSLFLLFLLLFSTHAVGDGLKTGPGLNEGGEKVVEVSVLWNGWVGGWVQELFVGRLGLGLKGGGGRKGRGDVPP